MCTVDWPTIFAGLKTILDPLAEASWPIALGIIVFSFRRQIAFLLNRIKQVTGFGGTAEFAPALTPTDQKSESPKTEVAATADPNKMPPRDPVYDPLDAQLLTWLNEHMPGDNKLMLAWAIRSRSISEAFRLHELHYRAIFGSQIQALKALNTVGRAPIRDLEVYFNAAASNPAWSVFYKDRSFDMWTSFLVDAGHLHFIPNSDPQEVEITPLGRQFLVWIAQNGLSENKPA